MNVVAKFKEELNGELAIEFVEFKYKMYSLNNKKKRRKEK